VILLFVKLPQKEGNLLQESFLGEVVNEANGTLETLSKREGKKPLGAGGLD